MPRAISYCLPAAMLCVLGVFGANAQNAGDALSLYLDDCMSVLESGPADWVGTAPDGFLPVGDTMFSKAYPAVVGAPLGAQPRIVLETQDTFEVCSLTSFEANIDDVKTDLPHRAISYGWTASEWTAGRYPHESQMTLFNDDTTVLVQLTDQRGIFVGISIYQPGA